MGINRRDFIKIGLTGMTAIAIGSDLKLPGIFRMSEAHAATISVNLTITDALVEMIDLKQVYMWTFADSTGPKFPGPAIFAREGDTINLSFTNALDEDHAVAISGTRITSGIIAPGQTRLMSFAAPTAGTYIYYDPLNPPVNRVLGLHGVLVVLPGTGNNIPYSNPTANVRNLFNDLGTTAHFPGNPWNSQRTFIWALHMTDPVLNALAEPAGAPPINRTLFKTQYLPQYFTISGMSGHFSSMATNISPRGRVGQPALIRIVNTGLVVSACHQHGNHVYVTSINGQVQSNVLYVDTFRVRPMDRIDWVVPFIRPPDIPPVAVLNGGTNPNQFIRLDAPQELAHVDMLGLPQSPLAYPMHDHTEPTQTSAGGNYNTGALAHIYITGDIDGVDFPS